MKINSDSVFKGVSCRSHGLKCAILFVIFWRINVCIDSQFEIVEISDVSDLHWSFSTLHFSNSLKNHETKSVNGYGYVHVLRILLLVGSSDVFPMFSPSIKTSLGNALIQYDHIFKKLIEKSDKFVV